MKIIFWDEINSIWGINIWNLDLKNLSSPTLLSLVLSQTTKVKLVKNSSPNSSPCELTQPSTPARMSFPSVRTKCAKTKSIR